jgi:hypothetical protein
MVVPKFRVVHSRQLGAEWQDAFDRRSAHGIEESNQAQCPDQQTGEEERDVGHA